MTRILKYPDLLFYWCDIGQFLMAGNRNVHYPRNLNTFALFFTADNTGNLSATNKEGGAPVASVPPLMFLCVLLAFCLEVDGCSADGDAGHLVRIENLVEEDARLAVGYVTVRRNGSSAVAFYLDDGSVTELDRYPYSQKSV